MLVAPCFDKKLEAVREEFYNSLLETRDVDCVLTSGTVIYAYVLYVYVLCVGVSLIFDFKMMNIQMNTHC